MIFNLNEYGFITNYLVSGKKETPYCSQVTGEDQLACEKTMRLEAFDHNTQMPQGTIRAGAVSTLGLPWEYYYNYGSWFVDQSAFYPLLKKIELHGATVLNAPRDLEVEAWLWSYGAVDVWVNGSYCGGIEKPVYKPISRGTLRLKLNQGENLIFVRLQNLGVRDTRTLFGIQVQGKERDLLQVTLPEAVAVSACAEAGEWLTNISLKGETIIFPAEAPEGSQLIYDSRPVDFMEYKDRYTDQEIKGKTEAHLNPKLPWFKVAVTVNDQQLVRNFERQELLSPVWSQTVEEKENEKRIYDRIASVLQIPRGDTESFSMYPILARRYLKKIHPDDEKEIYKSLDQIESRRDCSDFLTCALVRFISLYEMDHAMAKRCKEVMVNYRYWMDEAGNDGMCFWSENHSLMFFVSAYIAGDFYPDEIFVRSQKTGRERKEAARVRIYDWMKETIKEGFDEFHSGGYSPITFAAILNVVDFADDELSSLAKQAADRLLYDLSLQTFQGVSIAPMGRVYREVLYPYAQDIQSLVNLIDPEAPDRFSEWIIFLATSKYKIPEGLKEVMKNPISVVYGESNARICVEKTADYMLTSVQSKREGEPRSWENLYGNDQADKGSFAYVKSLNECFHGTTQFEPGVYGYQQHMWYAALDPAAVVFVNHPGGSCETCSTRPGYWFGNGVMPALKQVKNILYGIYRIPENHPIPFTHVYWPESRFEEQTFTGNWIFGKASKGYVAIWCSEELKPYEDQLSGCEYRADSRDCAYLCICGSQSDDISLSDFMESCKRMNPIYNKETGTLISVKESLQYEKHENLTQYI
ncbi:hypothetical protein [Clostridium sp. E02]|uniref:hypothetical protein n=1 Tax=Clostridium sp. E02 TaxID=2487134 RepID=UPI000F525CF7|nr:hypothetical protein [Clostridium sp. E02]